MMTFFNGEAKSGLRRKKCRAITGEKTAVVFFAKAKKHNPFFHRQRSRKQTASFSLKAEFL